MTAPALSKIDRLRARDGNYCWLCRGKLDFEAKPNSKRAPTKEHLQPLSLGGNGALDNLVLCHPGCNRQLGDRPRADKERMRAKRTAKAALAAAQTPVVHAAPKRVTPLAAPVKGGSRNPATDWRTVALVAIAAAMFFLGLALGLLLGGESVRMIGGA